MKDSDLQFDRSCHVLYTPACKEQIQAKIALHYPAPQREEVWEKVQRQFVDFLSEWRTDLGGKANFHNGAGGTYDCAALMTYYVVCKDVTSLAEIEEMEGSLFLPAFRTLHKLGFINANKPFIKKLLHYSFASASKKCNQWNDYKMNIAPYDPNKPIYYEFTACPVAEFAKQFGLLEVLPALCNPDYEAMELLHAKLVRTTTCGNGCKCDYTIYGDCDLRLKEHPEYIDEAGYRRNK